MHFYYAKKNLPYKNSGSKEKGLWYNEKNQYFTVQAYK